MPTPIEILRQAILTEVFVKQGQERIVDANAKWLMDFRRVSLQPEFLNAYAEAFYERFNKDLPFQVGGMEVAAIPLVAAIIMKMQEKGVSVNGFFIRKSRKKDGLLRMIEGKLTDDPIILVDDLINSAYTFDRQIKVLEEMQKKVKVLFSILRFRELDTYKKYAEQNIRVESIFSLDDFKSSLGIGLLKKNTEPVPQENFKMMWFFKSNDPKLEAVIPKSAPAIDSERVYFGSDRGIFFALNQSDGTVAWQCHIGLKSKGQEIFSSPVIHQNKVYFGAYDGNVYCLDTITGKRLWVSFDADWIHGSPIVIAEKNFLIVPVMFGTWRRKGGIIALNMQTGKKIWQREVEPAVQSTPVYAHTLHSFFVGSEDGTVFCLDTSTGAIRWTFKTGGAVKESPAYDESSGLLIIASFDGNIYALSAKNGLLQWRYETGAANYGAPIVDQERVYFASLDKYVYCLDIKTGSKIWEFETRARIFTSPRIYEGKLYFGGNDARFYELDPVTGKQDGFSQTTERITSPVAYNPETKHFFLSTYANELYCLVKNTNAEKGSTQKEV